MWALQSVFGLSSRRGGTATPGATTEWPMSGEGHGLLDGQPENRFIGCSDFDPS